MAHTIKITLTVEDNGTVSLYCPHTCESTFKVEKAPRVVAEFVRDWIDNYCADYGVDFPDFPPHSLRGELAGSIIENLVAGANSADPALRGFCKANLRELKAA